MLEGTIIESLPNAMFRVELTNHGANPASYVLTLTVLAIGGVGN